MPVRGVVEFGSEWLRKSKEPAIFFVEAICEPYVREEEARMMNGR
jgi:hypothetical protein